MIKRSIGQKLNRSEGQSKGQKFTRSVKSSKGHKPGHRKIKKITFLTKLSGSAWPAHPQLVIRHGKSRKHTSIACGQFLRILWTFL